MKIFQFHKQFSFYILALTIFALAACGGGSGGGSGGVSTSDVNNTATISSGAIEGFGSVIINGVRFNTDSADIEIENSDAGTFSDLRIGMQVTVNGTNSGTGNSGTASRVRFEDNLEGPISSVTVSSGGFSKTLLVMGQVVRAEQGVTMFDNDDPGFNFSNLGAANVGNVVEVSGHDMADGSIQATFIQKKADNLAEFFAGDNELEIKGQISNIDTAAMTFQIGVLIIDYALATLSDLDNAPDGRLANGLPVEVKSTDPDLSDNILSASRVEVKLNGLGMDDIAKAEVEGFIANLNTAAKTFRLNSQMVQYANATFRGGLEEELANNVKVEAEGPLANGTLNATKITFKESIKFEANASSVNASAGTFLLQGLPGITVRADAGITRFDNFSSLNDLVPSKHLRVRARLSGSSGDMVATRIILRDNQSDERVVVQGQVDTFDDAAGTVSLLNGRVVIDTNEIANDNSNDDTPDDSNFEIGDTPVNRDAFFAALKEGDIVKARARLDTLAGDGKTWEEIEIEVEDD